MVFDYGVTKNTGNENKNMLHLLNAEYTEMYLKAIWYLSNL